MSVSVLIAMPVTRSLQDTSSLHELTNEEPTRLVRLCTDAGGHGCQTRGCTCSRGEGPTSWDRRGRAGVYQQLDAAEVRALTRILSLPPAFNASRSETENYRQTILQETAHLPRTLKASTTGWVSRMCPAHGKLNIHPLQSIFRAFRQDLEGPLAATWRPMASGPYLKPHLAERFEDLQNMVSLWMKPQAFRAEFRRDPDPKYSYQDRLCLGCILSRMGCETDAVQLLGAMVLGRQSQDSPCARVGWCEGWVLAALGRVAGRLVVEDMHRLGDELREARRRRLAAYVRKKHGFEGEGEGEGAAQSSFGPVSQHSLDEDESCVVVQGLGQPTRVHQPTLTSTAVARACSPVSISSEEEFNRGERVSPSRHACPSPMLLLPPIIPVTPLSLSAPSSPSFTRDTIGEHAVPVEHVGQTGAQACLRFELRESKLWMRRARKRGRAGGSMDPRDVVKEDATRGGRRKRRGGEEGLGFDELQESQMWRRRVDKCDGAGGQ